MTLYLFSACAALGIITAKILSLPIPFSLLAFLAAGAIFAYAKFAKETPAQLALVAIILFGFGMGACRMAIAERPQPDPLAAVAERIVTLTGVVNADPDERDSYTQLVVNISEAEVGTRKIRTHEKILARVPITSGFRYGDLISISGKLERPQNFETDSGREFDYADYLGKDGIRYQMSFAEASLLSHGHGNPILAGLISVKRSVEEKILRVIPPPEGSLANGVLLGAKQSLGQSTLDDFKLAGLSHVVVLSGYNVSIVARIVVWIFSFLPSMAALSAGALSIVLFSMMAGGGASVVRAAVMALISLFARAIRREYNALRALVLAALAMVLQNPRIVTDDPSFQLSFIATVGIISVTPIIMRYFRFVPEKRGFRDTVATTVSTQLFVLPFLVYMSGLVSPVAFPANLLVLPLVPFAMLGVSVTALVAYVSQFAALVPGFASYGILAYILTVTHAAAHVPFGSFAIENVSGWFIALWYALYAGLLWKWHAKPRKREIETPKFDTSLAFEIVEE
ncbi:MAG TPA: ComEC/Rec2 family competence protein [Candidatus Paceibacterota bacterium]|jgi:competence protein ComEC|nr:ComEC/Rec2 family competence protein [Candidatus Paceibacterota bacterium]